MLLAIHVLTEIMTRTCALQPPARENLGRLRTGEVIPLCFDQEYNSIDAQRDAGGMSCFLCVGRFLNLSSCRSAWCEGEAVAV